MFRHYLTTEFWKGVGADAVLDLRRARSVHLAAVAAGLGLVLWVFGGPEPARPAGPAPPPAGAPAAGFAPTTAPGPRTGPDPVVAPPPARAPFLFRVGSSYLVGFLLGWAFRRFCVVSLLLLGAVASLVGVLQFAGVLPVDWAAVHHEVTESFSWLQGRALGLRHLLASHLGSTFAAALGGLVGARRRA